VSAGEASVTGAAAPVPATQVFGADEQTAVPVDVLHWVQLAQLVLREERVPPTAEVSIVFVGEDAIADLNRRFLDGDGPTDVLAFPIDDEPLPTGRHPDEGGRGPGSSDDPDEPPIVLGDVLVCPAVAARQAPEHAQSLEDELALLVVHGVLHLLDYDHAEPDEAARMQQRERELLARFTQRDAPVDQPAHEQPADEQEVTQPDGNE
jgi:probable rRNA maturation factor